jgi:chromate reductase
MAAHRLKFLSICGSLRHGSYNAAVERALPGLAPEGVAIEAAPWIGDIPLYNQDVKDDDGIPAPVETLAKLIREADGIVIVTPEYNYSIPGVLKNAIDWVSRAEPQPFRNKPVLLQSASVSLLGGVRAQNHLRQVMVYVEAHVFNRPEVLVASVAGRVDETTGELTDEDTRKLIRKQLAGFVDFVHRIAARTSANAA